MKIVNLRFWRRNRAQKGVYRTPYEEARFAVVRADGYIEIGDPVAITRLPWWQRLWNRIPRLPAKWVFKRKVRRAEIGDLPLGFALSAPPDPEAPGGNMLKIMTKGTITFRPGERDELP